MGILRVESFDHWATADAPKKGWTFGSAGVSYINVGAGRNGTNSFRLSMQGTSLAEGRLGVANSTNRSGIAGFALRPVALPGGIATFFGVEEGASNAEHLQLRLHPSGALSVTQNSSPVVPATAGGVITGATWQYIEFAWYIHQTTGSLEVRVNGVPVLTGTNIDTLWTATGIWTGVTFGGGTSTLGIDVDDVYVADDNVFRGDHRIMCVVASPGNGTYTDWTPSEGTNHGALVDDPTPNITDFNSAGIIGMRDTYNFAALGVPGIVAGVQTNAYMKADVAGTRHVVPTTRAPGGPAYDANGHILGPDWQYYTEFLSTNPVTVAPWTVTEIDDTEFGVKVEG
jgi:hypothetical protein